jgi:hypothetical protein
MEWNQINAKLLRAKAEFLKADRDLLVVNANERAMTHKFAEHLQREFPDWTVDCEYNRHGDVKKKLLSMIEQTVPADDEDGRTVFPDIIVHRRRDPRANLLVIEAKKSGNANDLDRRKLAAFMSDERFRYSFAVLLRFVINDPYDITFERHE